MIITVTQPASITHSNFHDLIFYGRLLSFAPVLTRK